MELVTVAPLRRLALAGLGVFLAAAPIAGQTLEEVDRLIRDGRVQEAREVLLEWESAAESPDRQDRQRALWFRGVLNLDPDQAASAFRRLTVLYPGGAFTDLALQRLAQSAAVRGELKAAEANYTVLARDYPGSPARQEAMEWLARNRSVLDSLPPDVGDRAPGGAERPGGTEARSRPVPPAGDTARRPPPRSDRERQPPPVDARAQPAQVGDFAAQLGAFTTVDRALALEERVGDAGFEARVVRLPGSDLFRVRVGRFAEVEAARALIRRLQGAGFEAGLATDATQERGIR